MKQEIKHHGEFLKMMCDSSKLSLTKIAEMSGYSRSSLYRWFDDEVLEPEIIYDVAITLRYDISGKIPEVDAVSDMLERRKIQEKELASRKATPMSSEYYKDKYLQLLERHSNLQQQVNDIQAKYGAIEDMLKANTGTPSGQKEYKKK